jgi:hypothetical protein
MIPSSIRRSIRKCGISMRIPYAMALTPRRMLAPGEVLESLVAVEARAILAKLGEPRPHLLDGRVDRHGVEDLDPILGEQLVARQLALFVLRFGAPTQVPRPDHKRT